MVTQRETRINELLEWAKKNNIKKSIPEHWSGRIGEWERVAAPIIDEARMRYKVTYPTARDYAHLVIELLIQSKK